VWEEGVEMQTFLGFVLFVGLVAAGLFALQAGGQVPQATIVLLSAGVAAGVWRWQENAKQTQDLEARIGSDKKVLYKLYLDVVRELVQRGAKADATKSVVQLQRWAFGSLLIASDEVVLAHDRFMNAGRVSDDMAIAALADVILAMRRDLSDGPTDLQPVDVLATFIKGGDDIDKMRLLCEKWAHERATAWRLPAASTGPRTARR
jgi:hypothetical protein